jgi:DNA-binding transcriptional LysR family regulator
MREIEARSLRALVAVADAHSFRAAAAELGYTQSAISNQIAALEAALGTPLLTRPGGRSPTQLTAAGEAAYRHARRALEAVESMEADVRAIHSERGVLRIGVFQAAASALLPNLLARYRRERPGVTVVLTEPRPRRSLVSALARGDLDLAITVNPEPDDRVEAIPLLDDAWVILTRQDSEIAAAREPGFELLDGATLIAWQPSWPSQAALEDAWRRRGIAPQIIYRTDDNLALQRLVAAGLGSACVGRLTADRPIDPRLSMIVPCEVVAPRTVAVVYPRRRESSSAARTLIELLRTRAGELTGA